MSGSEWVGRSVAKGTDRGFIEIRKCGWLAWVHPAEYYVIKSISRARLNLRVFKLLYSHCMLMLTDSELRIGYSTTEGSTRPLFALFWSLIPSRLLHFHLTSLPTCFFDDHLLESIISLSTTTMRRSYEVL
jgi:hypothetical protein